jgi:hypothetical protein
MATGRRGSTQAIPPRVKISSLLILFAACYGLVLVLSISFFDAEIPIDSRILSPLYPVLLALGIIAWVGLPASPANYFNVRFAAAALAVIVLYSQWTGSGRWLYFGYRNGIGYAGREWQESPLIGRIRKLGNSVPIFTNAPEVVYLLTARPAFGLPAKINTQTQTPSPIYPTELAKLRSSMQKRGGVLIYFSTVRWRWYLPSEAELARELKLRFIAREEDGALYATEGGGIPIGTLAHEN